MSTKCPPLLKVGKAGRPRLLFLDLKRRRRADSTSSDIVHPLRAASRFRIAITESSMFRVVFIWFTIQQRWMYVKGYHKHILNALTAFWHIKRETRKREQMACFVPSAGRGWRLGLFPRNRVAMTQKKGEPPNASLKHYLHSKRRTDGLEVSLVLPGHGEPVGLWCQCLKIEEVKDMPDRVDNRRCRLSGTCFGASE